MVGVDAHRSEHRRRLQHLRRARRARVHGDAVLVEREQDRSASQPSTPMHNRLGSAAAASAGPNRVMPGHRLDHTPRPGPRAPPSAAATMAQSHRRARGAEADPCGDVFDAGSARLSLRAADDHRVEAQSAAPSSAPHPWAAELVRGDGTQIGLQRVEVDLHVTGCRAARRRARSHHVHTPPRSPRRGLHRADLVVRELHRNQLRIGTGYAPTTATGSKRPDPVDTDVGHFAAHPPADRVAHARVLDLGGHHRPGHRPPRASAPHTAVFTDSVPDAVNTTSRGLAPKNAATCACASSTATCSRALRRGAVPDRRDARGERGASRPARPDERAGRRVIELHARQCDALRPRDAVVVAVRATLLDLRIGLAVETFEHSLDHAGVDRAQHVRVLPARPRRTGSARRRA